MSTLINMKSIGELNNYKFAIPNYQRGYRWTNQQVKELLNDIWEFSQKDSSLIYCIQPLVVCERDTNVEKMVSDIKKIDNWGEICKYVEDNKADTNQTWEVIDGQQRLTTISIVMQLLDNKAPYSISYDTLPDSEKKINNIQELQNSDAESDINLHFMLEAKKTVEDWLKPENGKDKDMMKETILKRVKIIWYKTDEKNPISVFTRLNVGRISLTSSELIKALFLNRENYKGNSEEIIRAKQTQIAQEWDKIENQLQDDEFWLFLRNLDDHKDSWNKPTRIDFLLDFLCKERVINQMNQSNGKQFCPIYEDKIVGKDKYRTFRIYYECYKSKKNEFLELWHYVKEIFDIWYEWYNHSELYHYVGYVLTEKTLSLEILVQKWLEQTRKEFIAEVKTVISNHLKAKKCDDLERNYYKDNRDTKRDCIPLLLLHNVETIVGQNKILTKNMQYQLGVFYKFPFHLYKIEHWDVEHIDSATENELVDDDSQRYWILSAFQCLRKEDKTPEICDKLKLFFEEDKNSSDNPSTSFSEIYKYFADKLSLSSDASNDWKNKVQNFVLLDSSTNRNYKNAIFPDKRSHIVGKEKGEHNIAYWDKVKGEIRTKKEEFKSAFVPICTKNVFQKTYSTMLGNPTVWDITDSEDYKKELENTLKEFINDEQQ